MRRGEPRALPSRGLTKESCEKWAYTVDKFGGRPAQIAHYYDTAGELVGSKVRFKDKTFTVTGSISNTLYGQWLWRDSGRRVIITEGEIDAISVSQVLQHKWQVVSIPNGAQGAKKALAAQLAWLNRFEEVVFCFDQDDAGRAAVAECVRLFAPGKVRVVTLPLKDANEMLVANRGEELVRALWDAKEHRPDGIRTLSEVKAEALKPVEFGFEWSLPSLTDATYGRRYGECIALGAGVGMGKTTLLTQEMVNDLKQGRDVAGFLFEMPPRETVQRIAGQWVGKTFHIPDGTWTVDELEKAIEDVEKAPGKLFLYDHFGSCDWAEVKERIRYLYHAHGVRIFYIDHLTALASHLEDERRGIDALMAEIGGLVKEIDIWICFVSHLTTPEGKSHEEGGRVMAKHFRGSRSIMQWAHFILGLERDSQSDEPEVRNQTTLRVLKDRPTGRSNGLTIPLKYDSKIGRIVEAEHVSFDEAGDGDSPF